MERTRVNITVGLFVVLGVGVSSGLVAYYVGGFPARAAGQRGGPEELNFVPRDVAAVAYANIQEIMASELRQKLHHALPSEPTGQREFQNETGINLETDVDRIVGCVRPESASSGVPGGAGMVLARGRFDEVKIATMVTGGRPKNAHEWVELMKGAGPLPYSLLSTMGPASRRRLEGELDEVMGRLDEDAFRFHIAVTFALGYRD